MFMKEVFELHIEANEFWNESTEEYIYTESKTVQLKHSLAAIAKWESFYCKPFLSHEDKTMPEYIKYLECMCITQHVDPTIFMGITQEQINAINKYMESPMTAATFKDNSKEKHSKEMVTAETFYYQMTALNIPLECQKWHINRLLSLIRYCGAKQGTGRKETKEEARQRHAATNAARRKRLPKR